MKDKPKAYMPRAQAPCIRCPDRFFDGERTCHSTCERFKEFKDARVKLNREIRKASKEENAYTEVLISGCRKRGRKKPPER